MSTFPLSLCLCLSFFLHSFHSHYCHHTICIYTVSSTATAFVVHIYIPTTRIFGSYPCRSCCYYYYRGFLLHAAAAVVCIKCSNIWPLEVRQRNSSLCQSRTERLAGLLLFTALLKIFRWDQERKKTRH